MTAAALLYDPARATYDAATEKRIDALLVGAIDPHVHTGPSIANRGLDHLEYARDCSKAGFAAIVTKDHDYSGVMTAWMIRKHFPELRTKIYSAIVLNNVVGGLNPYAVEHTAAMGGKICFLPTLTAANHFRWEKQSGWVHPASTTKIRPATIVPVMTEAGTVRDDVKEILDIVARNDMVLASGHLHISETWKVFEEAQKRGVQRLMLTHPEEIVDATLNDVTGLAAMGAYVEHSLCMFLEGSKFKCCTADDLRKHIEAAGVDKTIFCSDLGQVGTGAFHPIEGFRRAIKICIDYGYADADIRKMVSLNTAKVLGIEADLPGAA
jgi:hypothetical protein